MVRNERGRDVALEKVMLQMKWWLMGAMLRRMSNRRWDEGRGL